MQDHLSTNMMSADVLKGLATGLFGLLGTLLTIAVQWLKDRDRHTKRMRELEESCQRVIFWESSVRAISTLNEKPTEEICQRRASAEILHATSIVEKLFDKQSGAHYRPKKVGWVRRSLLLYWPPRIIGWFPRLIYYYMIQTVAQFVYSIAFKNPSGHDLYLDVVNIAVIAIIATVFWHISVVVERP